MVELWFGCGESDSRAHEFSHYSSEAPAAPLASHENPAVSVSGWGAGEVGTQGRWGEG